MNTTPKASNKIVQSLISKRIFRIFFSLLILMMFLFHASGRLELSLLDALERFTYDVKLSSSAPYSQDERIVIVDLDEHSLQSVGQWPWNRDVLALMIEQLFALHQVKSVSFDMVFAEPSKSDGLELLNQVKGYLPSQVEQRWKDKLNFDQHFGNALNNNEVILGFVFNQSQAEPINTLTNPSTRLSPSIRKKVQLSEPQSFTANLPVLEANSPISGFFDNPIVDSDGIYRKVPLVQQYGGGVYPSLALATVIANQDYPKLLLDIKQEQDYASV